MPPHGEGFAGATHSHSVEYPEDTWNLYAQVDPNNCTALNVTRPADTIGVFKPYVLRLTEEPCLTSAADAEIIVQVSFVSPVNVRRIMVIGGGPSTATHPRTLKCWYYTN